MTRYFALSFFFCLLVLAHPWLRITSQWTKLAQEYAGYRPGGIRRGVSGADGQSRNKLGREWKTSPIRRQLPSIPRLR